jgi:hypothetical protein
MDSENTKAPRIRALQRAMALVLEAVDLLDAGGDSPEAAAHFDLGLQQLRNDYRNLQR